MTAVYFQVNNVNDQIFAFMVAFNVMFGFAFLASSFVIFIVKERISGKFNMDLLSQTLSHRRYSAQIN
jgi:hypothetical protein